MASVISTSGASLLVMVRETINQPKNYTATLNGDLDVGWGGGRDG
jgi:hypothetical protein